MTRGPSIEQLLVQATLGALDEVVACAARIGPDSPARWEAQQALDLAFEQLWTHLPSLTLRCTSEGLLWDDALVLPSGDGGAALATILGSSALESLEFLPGAEAGDLRRLVNLLHRNAHGEERAARDLATLLFNADLPCIRYTAGAVEEAAPDPVVPPPPPRAGGARLHAAIRAEVEASAGAGAVEPGGFDSTMYFLDQSEIEYLQAAVDRQYSTDHTRSMLDLLLDTLELQADPATRTEVIEAIRALLPYLLGSGRFGSLAYLGDELRGILRGLELATEHREALKGILRSVSREGALTQIFLTLEHQWVEPTPESLEALVGQLDHGALETAVVWAGQLGRTAAREAVFGALETIFRNQPDRLVQLLGSSQRTVVQEALRVAARLRLEELVDGVTTTLDHEDPTVRRQATEVLGSIPGVPPMRGVVRMLRDPAPEVRMASYEVLLNRPYRGVAKVLRAVLESTELEALGLSERKLLFSAYGAAAGPDDAPELAALLAGKRSFGGRPGSSETRACAALALARIDAHSARSALSEARRSEDPVVRNAVRVALQERDG